MLGQYLVIPLNECMKEEIKDNNGKLNSHISKYCRDKFPIESNLMFLYMKNGNTLMG